MIPRTGRRATIVDVAHAAGVSRQTVSNALNSPEKLAPDTLKRVLAAIQESGYRPSAAARNLRQQRTHAIGLEINVDGERQLSTVINRFLVELAIASRAYAATVVPFAAADHVHPLPTYADLVQGAHVDAFILVDTRHGDPRPAWLMERNVPFTSFGRIWDDPTFTAWADVDGGAGVEAAVDHVVASGYRHIAFLGWPEGSETGDDRCDGWRRATIRHGLHEPDLIARTLQDINVATPAAATLIERLPENSAVVCASDVLATATLRAAGYAGRAIVDDLGVVGFDDGPLAEAADLTTVSQPMQDVANYLLNLTGAITNGEPPPVQGRLFAPYVVARHSTRQPVETHASS